MRTRRSIIITLTGEYLIMGAIFLATVIIARTYGTKEVGYYALFRLIPNLTNLLMGLGLCMAIPYLIGNKKATPSTILNVLLAASIPLSILMMITWWLAAPLLKLWFFRDLDQNTIIFACVLPGLICFNYTLNSIINGLQNFLAENILKITGEIIATLLLTLKFFKDLDASWLVTTLIAGQMIMLLGNTFFLITRHHWTPALTWDYALFREALSYGIKARVGTIANFLNFRMDMLFVSALLSPQIFGLYAIASKMSDILGKISASLYRVLYPKLAGKSTQEASTLVLTYFWPCIIINMLLGMICLFLLPRMMILFYGGEAANAVLALRIFIIGTVITSANGLLKGFHAGMGTPQFNSYSVLAGIPFIIIGNLMLTPVLGIEGAALSSIMGLCSGLIVNSYLFLDKNHLSLTELLIFRQISWKKL